MPRVQDVGLHVAFVSGNLIDIESLRVLSTDSWNSRETDLLQEVQISMMRTPSLTSTADCFWSHHHYRPCSLVSKGVCGDRLLARDLRKSTSIWADMVLSCLRSALRRMYYYLLSAKVILQSSRSRRF